MRYLLSLIILPMILLGCGGTKQVPKTAPPPIDENLLDLVPFETDLVLWADFGKLRAAPLWGLVDKAFRTAAPDATVKELLDIVFASEEAMLGFMDSEQFGNQLLIITRSAPEIQVAALNTIRTKAGSAAEKVDGFDGIRTKDMLILSLTPRTVLFGNDAVVRMAAKAGLKAGRSIVENPNFTSFKTGGDAAARMYYRSGLNTRTTRRFKTVAPRINPDAVSTIDGALTVNEATHIQVSITMETQMDATVFAEEIARTLNELKGNMIVLFLGLDWLRDKIVVTAEKNLVNMDIRLDGKDIETLNQLADRLKKIQELLGGMENAM